ncbi:MAG: hypothetical protein LBV07_03680 [Syntrophobacterales bacterium]|nr:hypothetical protein [Syntrophobacterales bacterium]
MSGETLFWWCKNLLIIVFSLLFFVFGLETLIGAYKLKEPHLFFVYFFSGSFIVLFSLTIFLIPILRIHAFLKQKRGGAGMS